MSKFIRVVLIGFGLLASAVFLPGMSLASVGPDAADTVKSDNKPTKSDAKSSWSIAFDNDIFVPGGRDQDYTYGLNAAFAGKGAKHHWLSLHRPLGWIDKSIGLDNRIGQGVELSNIEYGLFGFTPEDITQSEPMTMVTSLPEIIY